MNTITLFYNPYLPELKIRVNGNSLSQYSALMSYQHQRLVKWCGNLFSDLYREVNADFEVICISNDFACNLLEELANKCSHCRGFSKQPLLLSANAYERLEKLELLGCDETADRIAVPVINASDSPDMTTAVYDIICEQGLFEKESDNGVVWSDCPLTSIELTADETSSFQLHDTPLVIELCSHEDDFVMPRTNAPVYALIMGTETRLIKCLEDGAVFFCVEPDDIESLLLSIIEEEILCPLLSQLSYSFPPESLDLLTESERAELTLICQAAPICDVAIPHQLDMGRTVELKARALPAGDDNDIHIISDQPDVISIDGLVLYPHDIGAAEIAVFIGSSTFPAATGLVEVQKRCLVSEIDIFPHSLCIPNGGSGQLNVKLIPDNAENIDELRWGSSDQSVAEVDPLSGLITAKSCGRCAIVASTQETSSQVTVEVQPEIEEIVCPCSFIELNVGDQKEWRYVVVPENAYGADTLRVISSDNKIAEYRGGYVIGKAEGDCRIYIKKLDGTTCRELRVAVRRGKGIGFFSNRK